MPGVVVNTVRIEVAYPPVAARAAIWQRTLSAHGRETDDQAIAQVASRFSIGIGQIEQAARDAVAAAASPRKSALSYTDLAAAARAQCGAQLAGLAQRITPEAEVGSLVIPFGGARAAARDLRARDWTRDRASRLGRRQRSRARDRRDRAVRGSVRHRQDPGRRGRRARARLRPVSASTWRSIVSKYIGETEKNLDRIFAAAEHANAVLFFDEADALFGKRSEVKDAHDRYANIEIAYLLQKMESFDGLAILATNLQQNLDEAFARRLTFIVNFPFPEPAERRRAVGDTVARRERRAATTSTSTGSRASSGSPAATSATPCCAAAHLAAADGRIVTRAHLLHATRREFQKMGKSIAAPAAKACQ